MNLGIDASLDGPQATTADVLATWYASHSLVRRLWAIEDIEVIRILLALEPTVDGGDTQPAWLANSSSWAQELQLRTHKIVRLELFEEPSHIESIVDRGGVLITELAWRDPTIWTV